MPAVLPTTLRSVQVTSTTPRTSQNNWLAHIGLPNPDVERLSRKLQTGKAQNKCSKALVGNSGSREAQVGQLYHSPTMFLRFTIWGPNPFPRHAGRSITRFFMRATTSWPRKQTIRQSPTSELS